MAGRIGQFAVSLALLVVVTAAVLAVSPATFPAPAGQVPQLDGPPAVEDRAADADEVREPVQAQPIAFVVEQPIHASVAAERIDVGPGENGTVAVTVANLDRNASVKVQIVVEERPGVTAVDSAHRSGAIGPTDSRDWRVPLDLSQGLHAVDVSVHYAASDGRSGTITETTVFSKDADEPTPIQRLGAFFLVTFYVSATMAVATIRFQEVDAALLSSFLGVGLAVGSFVAGTELSRTLVESAIGTALFVLAIAGIGLVLGRFVLERRLETVVGRLAS